MYPAPKAAQTPPSTHHKATATPKIPTAQPAIQPTLLSTPTVCAAALLLVDFAVPPAAPAVPLAAGVVGPESTTFEGVADKLTDEPAI